MKKNIFLAATLFAAGMLTFTGCSKDDDKGGGDANTGLSTLTIGGVIENGWASFDPLEVTKITAYIGNTKIAEADVTNAQFSMTLTALADNLLTVTSEIQAELNVSNKNAKIATLQFLTIDYDDYSVGKTKDSYKYTESYWYVNADVTITGTITDEDENSGNKYIDIDNFDLKLKKGWNVVTRTRVRSEKEVDGVTVYEEAGSYKTGEQVDGLTWMPW